MNSEIWKGILIPFLGTSLGAACVYFMKDQLNRQCPAGTDGLCRRGYGGGVHLEPFDSCPGGIRCPGASGLYSSGCRVLGGDVVPAAAGYPDSPPASQRRKRRKVQSHLARTTMMLLAVTLHNIPEGMAVGMIYAGF